LAATDAGTLPEPSKVTVAEYVRIWLDGAQGLSLKLQSATVSLPTDYPAPGCHLSTEAQARSGAGLAQHPHDERRQHGQELSARTVGHAHRILHRALQRALEGEMLTRNVASVIRPPKVDEKEIEILHGEQIDLVLRNLEGHPLFAISALALATGMRRGELLTLRLCDVEFDTGSLKVDTCSGRWTAPRRSL
jgi:integrase